MYIVETWKHSSPAAFQLVIFNDKTLSKRFAERMRKRGFIVVEMTEERAKYVYSFLEGKKQAH